MRFPVKTGAPQRTVDVLLGGKTLRHFSIEFAENGAEWWAPMAASVC